MDKFPIMYQTAFSSKLAKLFLGFLLVVSLRIAAQGSQTSLSVSEQDLLVPLDVLIFKAKNDLKKVAELKTIEGRVALTGFSTEGGEISRGEINYLLKKMEGMTIFIPEFYFVRSIEGLNKVKVSEENNLVRTSGSLAEMQTYAKAMFAPYFTSFKLVKEKRTLHLSLTIYNTETAEIVWGNTWFVQHREKNFFIDIQLQNNFDFLFATHVGTFVGLNALGGIINFGANVGLAYSAVDLRRAGLNHIYPSLYIGFTMEFALVSPAVDNFSLFDLLLFLRVGGSIGALLPRGYTPPSDYSLIQARPILTVGFSFLFIQRVYFYIGADMGVLMIGDPMPTIITPVLGLGYRF